MTDTLDILIRRAQMRDRPGKIVDIGIVSGRFAAIEERITLEAHAEIDA